MSLVGPGSPLAALTKQVLESALEAELDEHLGYEHGDLRFPRKCGGISYKG